MRDKDIFRFEFRMNNELLEALTQQAARLGIGRGTLICQCLETGRQEYEKGCLHHRMWSDFLLRDDMENLVRVEVPLSREEKTFLLRLAFTMSLSQAETLRTILEMCLYGFMNSNIKLFENHLEKSRYTTPKPAPLYVLYSVLTTRIQTYQTNPPFT